MRGPDGLAQICQRSRQKREAYRQHVSGLTWHDLWCMAKTVSKDKLSLDTHLLDVYLTGLQAEVEAKVRRVAAFRKEMQKIDAAGGKTDRASRARAARALIRQVDEMLETNLLVRESLHDLKAAAEAVLKDLEEEA
jgi:hypothetical protein